MRGRERVVVAAVLAAAAGASGAAVGFVLGVALAWVSVGWVVVAGIVVGALVLDVARVPAPSVRRQVPQLWGRLFSPRVVAVLYGLRLGVGPLTILRTWWWWAAALLGAFAGAWPSVGVGAVFGVGRVVAMLAGGADRAVPWRRWEPVAVTIGVAGLLLALVAEAPWDRSVKISDRITDRNLHRTAEGGSVPTAAAAPAASTTTTAGPVDTGLGAALPEALPGDGWQRVEDEAGRGLGPLDLAAAVRAEADQQAERSLLETRRFVAGHARAWRDDDSVAYAAVYRFASPADAAAYLVDGFVTLESRGARVYDVPEPDGARGFSQGHERDVSHGIAFVRDDRFFLVVQSAQGASPSPDGAAALARAVEASATG